MRINIFKAAIPFLLMAVSSFYSVVSIASETKTEDGICPSPSYPEASIQRREEGTVAMTLHIDASGKVIEVDIMKSSGSKSLDLAAKRNFKKCKFPPQALETGATEWTKPLTFVWKVE